MSLPSEAQLLRIFIGEADKWQGKPLYEVIVHEARRRHMAGATVLRGCLGFGAESHLHSAKILRLSEDLPLVIEIVDTPESISAFLPDLNEWVRDGLVTLENVRVIVYRNSNPDPDSGQPHRRTKDGETETD
jgi:PII-like signaling protein